MTELPDDELTPEEANYAALTEIEHKAILALDRLAKRWPQTLTLVSMGGGLHVIRTGDPRYGESRNTERTDAIIASIDGIPNDGGDW